MWFAGLCVVATFGATALVRIALRGLDFYGLAWELLFGAVLLLSALTFIPALKALRKSAVASNAFARNDLVEMRIATSEARDSAWLTFGWGSFGLVALAFICFILTNDAAVGKTFFLLPLMSEKWWQVTKAFLLNNLFIFVVAEILVLVWGLVVALARMLPGPAGKPIRALAIIYCDVFRGLPAVVTLYLIGFGLPISGFPNSSCRKSWDVHGSFRAFPGRTKDGNPYSGDLVVRPGAYPDLRRLCGRSLSLRH